MKISSLYIAVMIAWINADFMQIKACHFPLLGIKKRAVTMDLRQFFRTCLTEKSTREVQWNGPVDYVLIHSEWWDNSTNICSNLVGEDTAECWLEYINNLLFSESTVLEDAKSCIIAYSEMVRGVNYTGSRFPSNRTQVAADAPACPQVGRQEFMIMFQTEFASSLTDETDETIKFFDDVITVLQEDMICTFCTCAELSTIIGTLEEYDYENETLECDQCWPTRFASMTNPRSQIARPLGRSSVKAARLRPRADPMCDTSTAATASLIAATEEEIVNEFNLRVNCLPARIEVRVSRCALINIGLDFLEELVIADRTANDSEAQSGPSTCEPEFYNNPRSEDVRFAIEDDFNTCGVQVEENNTHITYKYEIRTIRDSSFEDLEIEVFGAVQLEFGCTYPITYRIQSSSGIKPMARTFEISAGYGEGTFDVEISLFSDEMFRNPFEPSADGTLPTVTVPDPIFVMVQLRRNLPSLLLLVERCSATDNPNSLLAANLPLIVEQCASEDGASFIPAPRFPNTIIKFGFPSFSWTIAEEPVLYIVCEVRLCNIARDDCQRKTCGKKKRSVNINSSDLKYQKIIIGPIATMEKRHENCTDNNGHCSHKCDLTSEKNEVVCSCPVGYTLAGDGKTCYTKVQEENNGEDRLETSKSRSNLEGLKYITLCFVATILMLMMICYFIYDLQRFKHKTKAQQGEDLNA